MISNFPTPKSYNLAGLLGFQFCQAEAFTSFPKITDGKIIDALSLSYGYNWLNGYATAYTLGFTEAAKNSVQGKYYEQTIVGFLPNNRQDLINLMEEMDNRDFVVLIKDPNGLTRLVGGFGTPMRFSANYESGLSRSDSKGYQFQFYTESLKRAPIYL